MWKRNHAIVIGGSIAGLAAAKVLSESFEKVLVLEQDDPPTPDHPRRYIPQGAHLHLLNRGGVMAALQLFPNFSEQMKSRGISPLDETKDASIFLHGVRVIPSPSASYVYPQTRAQLEHYFYEQVQKMPQVEIRHHVRVQELIWDEHHHQVLGVLLKSGEAIQADLIVDASGRASKLPMWLEEEGYSKPHKDVVHVDLAYSSWVFRKRPGVEPPLGFHFEQDSPDKKAHAGVVLPTGNDQWFITLSGCHGDYPPTTPEEFLNFAKALPTQDVVHAMESLEPVGDIIHIHFKESIWNRFDKLHQHPPGIISLGDAMCSVNPKFASGMSLALQEATVLQALLRTDIAKENLAHRFYKKTLPFIESSWEAGASEDFLMTETTGDKPKNLKILQYYFDWVVKTTSYDQKMALAFLHVLFLAHRSTSLLMPQIILRVLFDHFVREKLFQQKTVRVSSS